VAIKHVVAFENIQPNTFIMQIRRFKQRAEDDGLRQKTLSEYTDTGLVPDAKP